MLRNPTLYLIKREFRVCSGQPAARCGKGPVAEVICRSRASPGSPLTAHLDRRDYPTRIEPTPEQLQSPVYQAASSPTQVELHYLTLSRPICEVVLAAALS